MGSTGPLLPAGAMPLLVVAIVIVAVLLVSRSGSVASAPDDRAQVTVADDGVFRLTLRPDRTSLGAGDAMAANASLTYLGAAPQVEVWTRGAPITVRAGPLEGGPPGTTASAPAVCAPLSLERGVAAWVPWTGNALRPGTWRLTASALLGEGGCDTGPFHALDATVVVTVGPTGSVSPSALP